MDKFMRSRPCHLCGRTAGNFRPVGEIAYDIRNGRYAVGVVCAACRDTADLIFIKRSTLFKLAAKPAAGADAPQTG